MAAYLPDTNVLIDFGRDGAVSAKLENAQNNGSAFLIAPPALIELVRGMIAGGRNTFQNDKKVFVWLQAHGCQVLELPRPFMAKILHTSTRTSGVVPLHYQQLVEMVANSADFDEFLRRTQAAGSVWRDISQLYEIHERQLEKELIALESIAARGGNLDLAKGLSHMFGMPGCRPNHLVLQRRFSAAIEYLESSVTKIRGGAKPRKNDRGLYVDFQMLLYLGRPDLSFLTKENFAAEIRMSPQKARIVRLEAVP